MNCPLKCDSLYERKETQEGVEITFKYLPFFYYLLVIGVILSLITLGRWTNGVFLVLLLTYMGYKVMNWTPMEEIKAAMQTKGVKVFGSKWSFSNPLRVIISK